MGRTTREGRAWRPRRDVGLDVFWKGAWTGSNEASQAFRFRRRLPAIGKPFAKLLRRRVRLVGQALQKVLQVRKNIDAVPMTTGGDAEQRRGRLGARGAAGEEPVLTAMRTSA